MHHVPGTDQEANTVYAMISSVGAHCRRKAESQTLTVEERIRRRKAWVIRKLQKKRVRVNGKRV